MIDKWLVRVITPAIIVKYTISLDYNCIVWKFRLLCLVDWVLSSCFLENVFKTPRKLWIFRFVFSESWNNFCWGTINNLVSTPATPSMSWNNPGTIKCCLGHYFSCNYYPDVVISSCKSYKRVAQPRTEPRLINIVSLTPSLLQIDYTGGQWCYLSTEKYINRNTVDHDCQCKIVNFSSALVFFPKSF